MRAVHDSQAELVFRKDRAVAVRVLIASYTAPHDDSKLIDLTPYSGGTGGGGNLSLGRGLNWVSGVQISDDKGEAMATATVTLVKRHGDSNGLSLSPYWPSQPNGPANPRPENAVIWAGRRIQIWTQLLSDGAQAVPSDGDPVGHWDLAFDGYTDAPDMGKSTDNKITLACRDRGAPLMDYWVYDQIPQVIPPGGTHTNDWYDDLTDTFGSDKISIVKTDTSLHDKGLFNELIANTYKRDNVDALLTAYKYPTPTLYNLQSFDISVPLRAWDTPQNTSTTPLIPQQPLLQILQQELAQFGWQCRYKWKPDDVDPFSGSFELQVYTPGAYDASHPENGRSYDGASYPPDQPDYTFVLSPDLYEIQSDKTDPTTIRNGVDVPYVAKTSTTEQHNRTGFIADAFSRDLYGYRYMRCTEDATGLITGAVAATLAAGNMVKDLSRPWRFISLTVSYMPVVELGDCIQLEGPNGNFKDDIWVVVDTITHGIADGKGTTTLKVRQIFVYSDAGGGTYVSQPFGTPPAIVAGTANNYGSGLHPRIIHYMAAKWGTGPTRNDALTAKYNFMQLTDLPHLKDPTTSVYIGASTLIDPMGAVDTTTNAWAEWTAATAGTYQFCLSGKVSPAAGTTYSDAQLLLQLNAGGGWSPVGLASNAVGSIDPTAQMLLNISTYVVPGVRWRVVFTAPSLSAGGEITSTDPCCWTIRRLS